MIQKIIILIAIGLAIAACGGKKEQTEHAVSTELESEQELLSESDSEPTTDIQYVMYIGTNDKDTDAPVCPPEEAKKRVEIILSKYSNSYAVQEASNSVSDNGAVYREYTLVAYISDTDIENVHAAADEILRGLNQSIVTIQTVKTETELYRGEQ